MAAPMGMRAATLRLSLVANQGKILPQRLSGKVRWWPRFQCQVCYRCLSSKSTDRQIKKLADQSDESTRNNNNNNVTGGEADDFFGIEETLRVQTTATVSPGNETPATEDMHEMEDEGDVIRGQERVLDVQFGFIRKDSDNPAVSRHRLKRHKFLSKGILSNSSQHSTEPADFLSRLVAHQNKVVTNPSSDIIHGEGRQTDFTSGPSRPVFSQEDPDQMFPDAYKPTDTISSTNPLPESSELDENEANFIDEQYFGDKYLDNSQKSVNPNLSSVEISEDQDGLYAKPDVTENTVDQIHQNSRSMKDIEEDSMDFIDEQYFDKSFKTDNQHIRGNQENDNFQRKLTDTEPIFERKNLERENLNFVDDQYFGTSKISHVDYMQLPEVNNDLGNESTNSNFQNLQQHTGSSNIHKNTFSSQMTDVATHERGYSLKEDKDVKDSDRHASFSNTNSQDVIIDKATRQSKRLSKSVKPNLDAPQTAYDVAMKIRLEKSGRLSSTVSNEKGQPHPKSLTGKKLDSLGFRILKDQVPDWTYTSREVLAKVLRDSIIYDDNDIVAIDKPYGLPSHGGPGVASSVGQLTPLLAQLLDKSGSLKNLHLIHRLDKDTTGVMLLARTSQVAWQVRELFRKRLVVKKYWLLTKGRPNPLEGIIDIPMGESTTQKIHRMCLRPEYTEETKLVSSKSSLPSQEAVTQYRVLDSHSYCALVECQPVTGLKHQLRVHMAHGLNTPILGDHKYSHFDKLAPQKLYPEILHRLGIRQSKVRHLAMHLHARLLVLPEFLDGRNLVLSARLPRHFLANMKRLKLSPSSK